MNRSCALCGFYDPITMFRVNGYTIVRCACCGLEYVDCTVRDDFPETFYQDDFFKGGHEKFGYADYLGDRDNNMRMASNRVRLIERFRTRGSVLDVGCAAGFFLEALGSQWDRYGCEPCAGMADTAREKFGDRIARTAFEQHDTDRRFDVITMWDSLEHVTDPNGCLSKAYDYLKDDGLLFIGTPDSGSVAARLLGRRWYYYVPPAHLFFFDRRTLHVLLRKHGFQRQHLEYTATYLSMAELLINLSYLSGTTALRTLSERFAEGSRWNFNFPYKVFDEMAVVARKSPKE